MEYVTPKFTQKQIVYLIHGNTIVKSEVSEIFIHYQVEKTIIKYSLRPYGMNQFVTKEEEEIKATLKEAQDIVLRKIKVGYSKADLRKQYKEEIKRVSEKYEKMLKTFDDDLKNLIKRIENLQDSEWDNLEAEYINASQKKETGESK